MRQVGPKPDHQQDHNPNAERKMSESTRKDRQMVRGILIGFMGLGFVLTGFSHPVVIGGAILGALGFWVLLESLS